MGASATLKRFAKSREKAYSITSTLNTARAKAISRINNVAGYFSNKREPVQLRAVVQLEKEIMALLPDEQSRFSNLRADMLQLISTAKKITNGHKVHYVDHGRSAQGYERA